MISIDPEVNVLVVGAGLSGLHLAQLLKKENISSVILEKSRGVGGRIATRRIENLGFDHGSPYLYPDEICRNFLKLYNLQCSVIRDDLGLYVKGGMNHIAKTLAQGLKIEKGQRAAHFSRFDEAWHVTTDEGSTYRAKQVVITAPLPQSRELLSQVTQKLPDISYSKALMGLFIIRPNSCSLQSFTENGHTVLAMPDRGLHPQGIVLRASLEFSERYFDLEDSLALSLLENLLHELIGQDSLIEHGELKKWKYAQATKSLSDPFLQAAPSLYLIGDYLLHSDARGSILSAEALAQELKHSEKDTLMQVF